MNLRHSRAVVGIWALVFTFGVIQAATWVMDESVVRHPSVIIRMVAAWVVVLTLAVVSTRRIGGLARTISQQEHARTATLDQVEQLEMSNAILQILSRSVDVPLAF